MLSSIKGILSSRELLAEKLATEKQAAEKLQAEFQDTVTALTREVVRELRRRGLALEAAADVVQYKFMQSAQLSKCLTPSGREMVRSVVDQAVEVIQKEEGENGSDV